MRIFVRCLFLSATLALGAAAQAAPLNYTNVDVGLVSTEFPNSSLDGDGVLVRGSFAFHPSFFLTASVADIGYDDDVDGFAWTFGVGGHMPINPKMDLVGRIAYVDQDVDRPGNDDSDSGYLLAATLRGFIMDKLELEGGVQHTHLNDFGNDTSLVGEGRYYFTPRIAGGILVQVGDSPTFGINARFLF